MNQENFLLICKIKTLLTDLKQNGCTADSLCEYKRICSNYQFQTDPISTNLLLRATDCIAIHADDPIELIKTLS